MVFKRVLMEVVMGTRGSVPHLDEVHRDVA